MIACLKTIAVLTVGVLFACDRCAWAQEQSSETETLMKLHACSELPAAPVTDEQLRQLVPDGSPGRVMVRWKLESQENTYGFNIYRSTSGPEGSYQKVNPWLIPGEGTTNVPKTYCFNDTPTTRGAELHYYIEEITMDGMANIVDGTKGTKVKVKTVAEERAWMKKKVNGDDGVTTASVKQNSVATSVTK